jgi:type VI secretion system protein
MPAGPSLYDMLLGQIGGEPLDAYGDRTLECLSMQQNVQRILNTRAGNQRYVLPQRF